MNATEKLLKTKSDLQKHLTSRIWFLGIGVARGTETPTLRVNVSHKTPAIIETIQSLSNGITIIIDEVGEISAQ